MKKLIVEQKSQLILTGFVLTLSNPILHIILSNWKHNDYYQLSAEFIAWTLCFLISIGFYYIANKRNEKCAELSSNSG
jgi:predicted permease